MKLIWIMVLIVLAGCATTEVGRPINYGAVQTIEIGKTTKAEVRALLGEPVKQREAAGGNSEFVYGHLKAHGTALPFYARGTAEGEKVIVKFDKNGVVQEIEKAKLQR